MLHLCVLFSALPPNYAHSPHVSLFLIQEKIEIAGIETAQELVANSYGVCLCSSLGVREYQNRLDIYSFGKQPVTWKFVAALRIGGYMTEPLKYLIQLYQTAAERVQGKYNEDVYTI